MVALGSTHSFILFYPTILVVTLLAGYYPGLLATVLSAAISDYFFVAPRHSFKISRLADGITLSLFVLVGCSIVWVAELIRRGAARLHEFEQAVEGLEEMIAVIDREYRYLLANRAFLDYSGRKRAEVLGHRVGEVLNPDVFESTVKERIDECLQGKTVQFEMRYCHENRGERDLLVSCFPLGVRRGVDGMACILQDITDRKESERSLRLFRALMDESKDAVEVIDPANFRFVDVNEKSCQDLGYTRAELLSMTVCEIDPVTDHSACHALLDELKQHGALLKQTVHRRKDGSEFPVEVSLKYVEMNRGYIIAVSRDITERLKAEQTLRESEDRYRDLVENSQDLLCTHDLKGNLLSVNPAPARLLGYEVNELLNTTMRELIAPEFQGEFDAYLERMRIDGSDEGFLCVVSRTGQRRIWEYKNSLRTEGVVHPIVRGIALDVTEKKWAEQALRQREEDYRQFVAQSSEGIFREDLDEPLPIDLPEDELVDRIIHDSYMAECNDAMARMYGYESRRQLVGKRLTEMLLENDPGNIEMTRQYIRSGFRVLEHESHEVDLLGNPKVFRNSLIGIVENGKLLRTWGIQRDVTEQVKLEKERSEAESALRKSEEHFRHSGGAGVGWDFCVRLRRPLPRSE